MIVTSLTEYQTELMVLQNARFCVTGAGGFLASWVIKLLLSNNCTVHGTVRDPSDKKYSHLKSLDKASENLKLFKADLLDYDSLCAAIDGCDGVFHIASPALTSVSNPEVELMEPAVKGTFNVLKASLEAKVKRVVYVSSIGAVAVIPDRTEGKVLDETCWSDKELCRKTENWYCLSKTEAESEAWEFAKTTGIDLVTICPTIIFGPILQSTVNTSSMMLIKLFKELTEGKSSLKNSSQMIVDVRDVAQALVMAYDKPEAKGRYLCGISDNVRNKDLVEKLRRVYPNYNYPNNFVEAGEDIQVSSKKLQSLGWSHRTVEETLIDSIESYKKAGLLD